MSYLSTVWSAVLFALYPICLVILGALFTYGVTVESGAMEKIKEGLASVSDDRRILSLLIVWGLGTFMEGMAGFGTAVAIPVAVLVGIGFDPMKAVLMCLVANTTQTAYGSVGVPILTLAKESGCDARDLFVTTAFLELAVTAAGPFLVLTVADGFRGLKGMWGYLILADTAFLVPWLFATVFLGCELPNILAGISVMLVIGFAACSGKKRPGGFSFRGGFAAQLRAWIPFACVVTVLGAAAFLPPEAKMYAPVGGLILVAGFAGGLIQGLSPLRMIRLVGSTIVRYRKAFLTIICVLCIARVLERAGVISILAEGLVAVAGEGYPFFSAAVGALGGFVTGSGTNACVLFGKLQVGAANAIGASPTLLAASNLMGAGIGKMICPQSVAIGIAAAGLSCTRDVVRRIFPYFVAVILGACLITGLADIILG